MDQDACFGGCQIESADFNQPACLGAIETIASGRSIRELRRLNRVFGVKGYETQISALR
jgi:hypothetical protein